MSLIVDIKKRLGSFSLSAQLEAGEGVTGILGSSGCGKSMTLKCIAGIERPDSGHIELDGVVLYDSRKRIDLHPQQRRVGYLFQNYALFPNMTVKENIMLAPVKRKKMTKEEIQKVEDLVNEQIKKDLKVTCEEMNYEDAKKSGAIGLFTDKYGEKVKVYTIGDFSKEICGGPHVTHTGDMGRFKIKKEESSSSGIRRIKAVLIKE